MRLAVIAAAVVALLVVSAGPVYAAKTPFDKNLLKNPGAEAGAAAADGSQVVAVPSWQTLPGGSHFTVVKYGTAGGYPALSESQRINGSKQFFAGGLEHGSICASAYQRIFLKGRNALIDASRVRSHFSLWIATFDSQSDAGRGQIVFLDANSDSLGTTLLGPLSKTDGVFRFKSTSQIVPVGTRSIQISLVPSAVHQGAECDAYFDNVSLKLGKEN